MSCLTCLRCLPSRHHTRYGLFHPQCMRMSWPRCLLLRKGHLLHRMCRLRTGPCSRNLRAGLCMWCRKWFHSHVCRHPCYLVHRHRRNCPRKPLYLYRHWHLSCLPGHSPSQERCSGRCLMWIEYHLHCHILNQWSGMTDSRYYRRLTVCGHRLNCCQVSNRRIRRHRPHTLQHHLPGSPQCTVPMSFFRNRLQIPWLCSSRHPT